MLPVPLKFEVDFTVDLVDSCNSCCIPSKKHHHHKKDDPIKKTDVLDAIKKLEKATKKTAFGCI